MPQLSTILRTVLGLAFVTFGLNYFFPFLPAPAPSPEVLAFVIPFVGAKYMGLIKIIEIGSGLLLLGNRFVPLALTLLAPILVGITVFHVSLEPAQLPLPLALVAIEIALAWLYRDAFAPMLAARTTARRVTGSPTVVTATVSA